MSQSNQLENTMRTDQVTGSPLSHPVCAHFCPLLSRRLHFVNSRVSYNNMATSNDLQRLSSDTSTSARDFHLFANNFAFALAGNFHRDVGACTGDQELRAVYRNYRDQILKVNEVASCLAATLDSVIDQKLIAASRGEDYDQWRAFKDLARKARNSKNRASQQLQHQTTIIAAWGLEVFQHYGWHALPYDMTRKVRDLARVAPRWDDAVREFNRVLLLRHERRVIKGDNQAQLIGEHSAASKIQASDSPVEKRDVLAALSQFKAKDSPLRNRNALEQINGTPIQKFGLKKDRLGMVVPLVARAREREQSTNDRPLKRRKKASDGRCVVVSPDTSGHEDYPATSPSETSTLTDFESVDGAEFQPSQHSKVMAPGGITLCEEGHVDREIEMIRQPDSGCRRTTGSDDEAGGSVDLPEERPLGGGVDEEDTNDQGMEGFERNIQSPLSQLPVLSLRKVADMAPQVRHESDKEVLSPVWPNFEINGPTQVPLSESRIRYSGSGDVDVVLTESISTKETLYRSSANVDSALTSLQARHSANIGRLRRESSSAPSSADVLHQEVRREWLNGDRWAQIYAEPEAALGLSSSSAEHSDVWYLTWESFRRYSDAGYVFRKPVVVKQKFQDSGMYNINAYVRKLFERYPSRSIDVQNGRSGVCSSMQLYDYMTSLERLDLTSSDATAAVSNAIDLKEVANADEPLFTRIPRFQLLSTLVERAGGAVGKTVERRPADVENCLHFDLLGLTGSFSRPHIDALVGTWVRCLIGSKAWMITTNLDDEDWRRFANDGSTWTPRGKQRMIVLEQDDVLLMPPGLRVIHAVFSLEPCLMTGGMLWDERNIPEILDGLIWIANNQTCTNEALAYQLPDVVEAFQAWFDENCKRLASQDEIGEYRKSVYNRLDKLRSLGCECSSACGDTDECTCIQNVRRCTSWCHNHPKLPPQKQSYVGSAKTPRPVLYHCMFEEQVAEFV